jgi:hypothetical protein
VHISVYRYHTDTSEAIVTANNTRWSVVCACVCLCCRCISGGNFEDSFDCSLINAGQVCSTTALYAYYRTDLCVHISFRCDLTSA